ncbi:MAG: TlpA disulfide reductase family protein [Planctomycetota bacterium]
MFRRFCCLLVVASLAATAGGPNGLRAEDAVAKPADRYAVPEGDVAAIITFLKELESYQPTKTEEILAYRQHARKAFQTAAERIITLEQDKSSDAYRKAASLQLQLRLSEVQRGTAETQEAFYKDLLAHLKTAKSVSQQDLALAYTFGQVIEQLGNVELAKNAYGEFGKIFTASEDEKLAGYGQMMAGVARRLDLPGKEMKLEGKTADGKPFDWKSYRGKVVLVDFWATWCGPCVEELPNVKENYDKYHDQGFEVVGISLDADIAPLQRFLAQHELPWVCLFEEGAGTDHPLAKYYGVTSIPASMLLDRDGKVVAMGIRGSELGRQLAKLLDSAGNAEAASE